jgi:hypothetical protein
VCALKALSGDYSVPVFRAHRFQGTAFLNHPHRDAVRRPSDIHIDINVGDPVWPQPQPIELPRILGGTIEITGYPLTMVLAEKIVTMVLRGTVNTRRRAFVDVNTSTGNTCSTATSCAKA